MHSDEQKEKVQLAPALAAASELECLQALGYTQELKRNRSALALLSQSLLMSCIPYGIGGPLITAIYGGGQLPLFVGFIIATLLSECVAVSLAELVSRFPTSAGPYYWCFQLSNPQNRTFISFVSGWTWLVGNWTITLSAHFGLTSFICSTITLYDPTFTPTDWQLLLIFWALLLLTLAIIVFGNEFLPVVDTASAILIAATTIIALVCLFVEAGAGRHSVRDTLFYYDTTLSGWAGFSFCIGILPSAYCYSAIGMVSSMAEECHEPTVKLPKALSLVVPVAGFTGLFFIIPLNATLPPLSEILDAPNGQGLCYVYTRIMDNPGGGLALSLLIAVLVFLSCISLSTATSRCTWALARDQAIPLSRLFQKVNTRTGVPIFAAGLSTLVQALLGLINLGSTSAFTAFVSVGVISLSTSYILPVVISVYYGRKETNAARWSCGSFWGLVINCIAMIWVAFQVVLFSMPTSVPPTPESMNYAIVVFVGTMTFSVVFWIIHARKTYKGPPESDSMLATY